MSKQDGSDKTVQSGIDNNSESTEPSPRKTRRRLLQGLATGASAAALPDSWMRPVVNTVVLPAHAQTTVVSSTSSKPHTSSTSTTAD